MKATLDRIEGEVAMLLVRGDESLRLDVPLALLPPDCKEGDVLEITITRDVGETEAARERVSSLLERLKSKGQDGHEIIQDSEDGI